MKKKVLYTLILGALFISATLTGAMATETDASASKRSGLYSKAAPTEKTTSAPTPSEATGLYSPLRASGDLGAGGRPGIDEGIGAATPIGEAPKAILFVSALIYLSFVFIRKQNKLRTKN